MTTLQDLLDTAVQLHRSGRIREAIDGYLKVVPRQANNARLFYLLGTAYLQAGEFRDGIAQFQRSIALDPRNPDALNNLGYAYRELGRFDEALATYRQALAISPEYAEVHVNLGNTCRDLGRFDEALACLDVALRLRPDYAECWYNRGNVLRALLRPGEALASYDRALALNPAYAEAHGNRGIALQDLRRCDEALSSFDKALALKPDYAEAHHNRGIALQELERVDEALASYERALALKPDYENLPGLVLHTRMKLCDWTRLAGDLRELGARVARGEKATSPFPLLALLDDPAIQRSAATLYAQANYPASDSAVRFDAREPRGRIRVGYYSADFCNHPVAFAIARLFELHDPERFEVYGFAFGPPSNDAMRQRIAGAFHQFFEVAERPDDEIAQMSRELGIDVAVDLNGYTAHSRPGIFGARCAPIQVSYLGFPGTTGLRCIDYVVADGTVIPEGSRQHYSEKIASLPYTYMVTDPTRELPDRAVSRTEAGLPEHGFVYCCFNHAYKILPATFDGWMRILTAVEGSVLWLRSDKPTAESNLRKEARARGVDDSRIVFAGRVPSDEHYARHRVADLFLDTLPYNAHSTASDAVWTGLPVLTLLGRSFAARVAASLLGAVGLPELITTSQADYERRAIELARDPEALREIRAKLARNRRTAPLFDTRLFARHLEAAYTGMIERHRAGLPPDHIRVAPVSAVGTAAGS